jgi:hypothetical protein
MWIFAYKIFGVNFLLSPQRVNESSYSSDGRLSFHSNLYTVK